MHARKAVYLAAAKEECSCVSRKHVCEGSLLLHLVDSKGGRCYGLGLEPSLSWALQALRECAQRKQMA